MTQPFGIVSNMENPSPVFPAHDDEIDLWTLWEMIWSDRWLIVATVGVFTLGGVTYALLAQEWFRADVVLSPAGERGGNGGALAQFGGLKSLAGISLTGSVEGESVAVLTSRDFARSFITDLNLMPVLLEGSVPGDENLDVRDAVAAFDSVRSVSTDNKSGLVTLSIRWKDPEIAAEWANALVERVNDRLRTQAQEKSERNVDFLQREIAATSVISLQQSMGRVLEGEMQKLLLARGNEEFAFKVIDRATAPKEREAPKRSLIAIMSMLAGAFTGIIVGLLRKAIMNHRRRRQ
jgi:uncharacterized protein involved in exopolysaccharide biosynthesis